LPVKFAGRWLGPFLLIILTALPSAAQIVLSPTITGKTAQEPAQSSQNQSSQNQQSQDPQNSTQSTAKPSAGTPQDDKSTDKNKDQKDKKPQSNNSGTSNDRLFFTLPNFLSVSSSGKIIPLTPKQKFAVVARSSFDPIQFAWYGALSTLSQAEDSEPGYGQGWAAYGKRYGTSFADGTIENFMVGAVFPSMLRQDPRFYELGKGSFFHRTEYAVSRIFITRSDSGKKQFNFSEIVGSATAASISTNLYHPRSHLFTTPTGVRFVGSDRTLANTASVWGSLVGYDTITIVIKEFWPDIHRKLAHKKTAEAAPAQ
jgi:hypothetical protein